MPIPYKKSNKSRTKTSFWTVWNPKNDCKPFRVCNLSEFMRLVGVKESEGRAAVTKARIKNQPSAHIGNGWEVSWHETSVIASMLRFRGFEVNFPMQSIAGPDLDELDAGYEARG